MTMTAIKTLRLLCVAAVIGLMTGCWFFDAKPSQPQPPMADFNPGLAIANIRATAQTNHLAVVPLRDGSVTDLLATITQLEKSHQYIEADTLIDQARTLQPNDPELTQIKAELLLGQKRLDAAVQWAHTAHQQGPKVGPLCRRSWALIRFVHQQTNQLNKAAQAEQKLHACDVRGPERL